MKGIEGRVAMVSGASRGIGRAVALQLAGYGARLALLARRVENLKGVAEELEQTGAEVACFGCDVTDRDQVSACVDGVSERLGPVELLLNNAGVTADNLFIRLKPEQWDQVLRTNLGGAFNLTQACVRGMLRARFGRVVSVSSVVGLIGNPGQVNYAASKAGLVGFSKSLAREVASRGITVNVVAPGFIETDMTAQLDEAGRGRLLANVPLGRAGVADDVAGAVCFLFSDAAAYITGAVLPVDGGMAM